VVNSNKQQETAGFPSDCLNSYDKTLSNQKGCLSVSAQSQPDIRPDQFHYDAGDPRFKSLYAQQYRQQRVTSSQRGPGLPGDHLSQLLVQSSTSPASFHHDTQLPTSSNDMTTAENEFHNFHRNDFKLVPTNMTQESTQNPCEINTDEQQSTLQRLLGNQSQDAQSSIRQEQMQTSTSRDMGVEI
jgi:hypothetical protein